MPRTFPLTQNGSAKISGVIRPGHRQDYRGALSLEFVMEADERRGGYFEQPQTQWMRFKSAK